MLFLIVFALYLWCFKICSKWGNETYMRKLSGWYAFILMQSIQIKRELDEINFSQFTYVPRKWNFVTRNKWCFLCENMNFENQWKLKFVINLWNVPSSEIWFLNDMVFQNQRDFDLLICRKGSHQCFIVSSCFLTSYDLFLQVIEIDSTTFV